MLIAAQMDFRAFHAQWTGIVIGDHQVVFVVFALVVQPLAILPAIPDRMQRKDVVTHSLDRWQVLHSKTPGQMRLDLGAYPELEPAARKLLDRPRPS